MAVTVWPESHLISKRSEHQRVSLAWTETVPVCARLDGGRRGAFGSNKALPAITRYTRLGFTRGAPELARLRLTSAQARR